MTGNSEEVRRAKCDLQAAAFFCLQTFGRSWLIFPDLVFPQTSSAWPVSQPREHQNISHSLHTWDLEWIHECLWFVVSVHTYFLPNAPSWRNHIQISLFLHWDRILLCSLDGLVLTVEPRLALNSQHSSCLSFPSTTAPCPIPYYLLLIPVLLSLIQPLYSHCPKLLLREFS